MKFLTSMIYLLISFDAIKSQIFPDHPIANPSTSWINNWQTTDTFSYKSGFEVKAILTRRIPNQNMAYACGFYWIADCYCSFFSVFVLEASNTTEFIEPKINTKVIWSANRNNPIKYNSTLQFTTDGDLVLRDVSGELVWCTSTAGKSVAGLNMTESGNLVLFDVNNSVVWQSFDYPTDTLFLDHQKLRTGDKLIDSISKSNWTEGLYSYAVTNDEHFFYVGSYPQDVYYHGNISINTSDLNNPFGHFIQLGSDGHLRRFQLDVSWNRDLDVLENEISDCQYPLVCGEYGVCQNGECSNPQSSNSVLSYFRPIDSRIPNLGFTQINPLDCNASDLHGFVKVEQVSYFTFRALINNTDEYSCKKACLGNCSCKAAIFRGGSDNLVGDCYLPSKIYSLMDINEDKMNNYNLSVFLKVQTKLEKPSSSESSSQVILGLTFGALLVISIVVV